MIRTNGMRTRQYWALLATAVLAFPLTGARAAPTGVWSGTTTGATSGITWSWRLESKGDRVDVKVLGQLNGETYPAQCDPGRFVRSQEFVATCRYLKGAKGVVANSTFELRADLGRDTTDVTFAAGTFVSHFILQKEPATAPPATSEAPTSTRIGPSFPCRTVANQPLAQLICYSDELSRLDLAYVIAYQAVLNSLDARARQALGDEASAFVRSTTEQCQVPASGFLGRAPTPTEIACIKDHYERQRQVLIQRAFGPAAEEAVLGPDAAIAVQKALKEKGALPQTATVDGVFGPGTRTAIVGWERANGMADTGGFVTRAVLARLVNRASAPAAPSAPVAPAVQATPAPSAAALPPPAPSVAPRDFGSCEQISNLSKYNSYSFESGTDPILGVPPADWTLATLDAALDWGRRCIATARQPGGAKYSFVVPLMESQLRDFAKAAQKGIPQRATRTAAAKYFDEKLDEVVTLPNGAKVTCRTIAGITYQAGGLDKLVFGVPLRQYKEDDFQALLAKRNECVSTLGSLQSQDRQYAEADPTAISYLQNNQQNQLREEQRAKEEAAAAKQREAQDEENEKRMSSLLPLCNDEQVVEVVHRLIAERNLAERNSEPFDLVDAQRQNRVGTHRSDGLESRDGMEWRNCQAFIPYELYGAQRKNTVLYKVTWKKRATGEWMIEVVGIF